MRATLLQRFLFVALATGLGCGRPGGDASITYMSSVLGSPDSASIECWVEIAFDELDPALDASDVEIRLESVALVEPVVYDWVYIATHDTRERAIVARENDETKADTPPGPGVRTNVRVRADVLPGLASREVVFLHAKLYWGGVEQDADRRSLYHVFGPEIR